MRLFYYLSLVILGETGFFQGALFGQNFKVLHYTETSGFDHQTRQNSLVMLQNLGAQHGFTVDDDQTGAAFDSASTLQQYAVVVFSNTSGDQILDSNQRANFESYIQNGGSLLGIHAASDTYRHSSANGSNTGTWDWYASMLGASVQQNPNHTAANYHGTIDLVGSHPTTARLPDPWNKVEEYYYWENGYYNSNNTEVLRVRSTGGQSYDAPRAVSWYKEMFGGARLFYTALGHANSNFTSDTAFQNHIRDAIHWAAHQSMDFETNSAFSPFQLFPNPVDDQLTIRSAVKEPAYFAIMSLDGKICREGELMFNKEEEIIELRELPKGHYYLKVHAWNGQFEHQLDFMIE